MINAIREWLAFWFLEKALRLLPVSSSAREGMLRGLKEQRDYDRYEAFCILVREERRNYARYRAYCRLQKTSPLAFGRWQKMWQSIFKKASPLPFNRWREVRETLRMKASGAEQANATLRAAGRPAFQPAISRL